MPRKANYPEWVMRYKTEGTYVNRVGDTYYLYAAHSERVKGKKYPVRVSDGYLGKITEKDGFIPPKEKQGVISYEFGFSYFVISKTPLIYTALKKSYTKNGEFIYAAAILMYIYGTYSRELLERSYLSLHFSITYPESISSSLKTGIERGCRMISSSLSEMPNEEMINIRAYFSTVQLVRVHNRLHCTEKLPVVKELSEKYEINWDGALWQK